MAQSRLQREHEARRAWDRTIKQQEVTKRFFSTRSEYEAEAAFRCHLIHVNDARRALGRVLKRESDRTADSVRVVRRLSELDGKFKRTERVYQAMAAKKLEKTIEMNQRFETALKRRATTSTRPSPQRMRATAKVDSGFNVSFCLPPSRLDSSLPSGRGRWRTPGGSRAPSSTKQYKNYQELMSCRAQAEEDMKARTASRIHEQEAKARLITSTMRQRFEETREQERLRKSDHEENLRRIQIFRLLQKRETLERLQIPIAAYPHIDQLITH